MNFHLALVSLAIVSQAVLGFPLAAFGQTSSNDGSVEIPVEVYNALVEASRDPVKIPRAVPASYALGSARASITVGATEPRAAAGVRVDLGIEVLEDEWVLIPVLPSGTAVESVTVQGTAIQLIPTPQGLVWATNKSGSFQMSLTYRVDAARSKGGFSLAVPLPSAASIQLNATLPGDENDVSVIPAAGVRTTSGGGRTSVNATVPTTQGVQIAWRAASDSGHTISRAQYTGELSGDAVTWSGELEVELFTDETVMLELLPRSVTLNDLRVDEKNAAILIENEHFATPIKGRGRHSVVIVFQSPVVRADGPPRVDVSVPAVPVSRFELTLPGRKEVSVTPATNVDNRVRGETTVATVYAPLSRNVSLSWAEAVPEDVRAEARANVGMYHAVHAEEGVLYVRAFALYEVTRGETNQIRLTVPPGVQVNRITAASGAVADWRIEDGASNQARAVSVFLDRKIRDQLLFEVHYDRSLSGEAESTSLELPLLEVPGAHRQRGMVALLSSNDLTLSPVAEGEATRVGENQLPSFVRQALEMTVAHTFKYVETPPQITVEAMEPERQQGRFDAQVDTLIKLDEGTLSGAASLELSVKSGRIMALELSAPSGVNILNLTGPSIRTHKIVALDEGQQVDVQFTQEMEGQFRLEIAYELILGEMNAGLSVPTISVVGADVEQGRIAVEALSAVEVQPLQEEQLTALDISELPQQLILRTTNPILLAYKYVHSDPPHRLVLQVTRHELLDVQEAAIDIADYRTLFTRDGLAVTTAHFVVRNSNKQFLRIQLPPDAKVWSAFVDGRPEKPARAAESDETKQRSVLLKIVNSTRGFPVHLIYATPGSKIRGLGSVEGILPRPEILVTQSRWDVYLPAEMRYGEPTSNMDPVTLGNYVSASEVQARMDEGQGDGQANNQVIEPLKISVPTAGIHYAFEKLYANQGDEEAWFRLSYATETGARVGGLVATFSTLLMWFGILLWKRPMFGISKPRALFGSGVGLLVLGLAVGRYGVSASLPVFVTLTLLTLLVVYWGLRYWQASRPSLDE